MAHLEQRGPVDDARSLVADNYRLVGTGILRLDFSLQSSLMIRAGPIVIHIETSGTFQR